MINILINIIQIHYCNMHRGTLRLETLTVKQIHLGSSPGKFAQNQAS